MDEPKRCDSEHHRGLRCEKDAGHPGYHWHSGTNGVQIWGIPRQARVGHA